MAGASGVGKKPTSTPTKNSQSKAAKPQQQQGGLQQVVDALKSQPTAKAPAPAASGEQEAQAKQEIARVLQELKQENNQLRQAVAQRSPSAQAPQGAGGGVPGGVQQSA